MNGIENWFVLTDIFGDDFSFVNSQIECINSQPFAGNVWFDIIVGNEVKKPPKKWNKWEKVHLCINFFTANETYFNIINSNKFIIKHCDVTNKEDRYNVTIEGVNGDVVKLDFWSARIQNIKPLVYNTKYNRYEVL